MPFTFVVTAILSAKITPLIRNKRDKKAQEDADKLFGSLAQKSLIFTKSQSGMASEMFNFAKAIKNARIMGLLPFAK